LTEVALVRRDHGGGDVRSVGETFLTQSALQASELQ